MDLNPSQFRLLLAGPKVSRLLPFVTSRGYVADGCLTGADALELMRHEARHVLLVELELEDMLLADMLQIVRRENLAGAIILLDDPAKSGMIISQLIRGVDGYVATPPDELYLFRLIERQLLAQWAFAQTGRAAQDQEDKLRLERAVQAERAKVTQLVKEIAALREEVTAAHAAKAKPAARLADDEDIDFPDTVGLSLSHSDLADDDDEIDDVVTARIVGPGGMPGGQGRPPVADERTSPVGWETPAGVRSAASKDIGFDDASPTRPAPVEKPKPEKTDDDDDGLFLDLEDPTATVATESERTQHVPNAGKGAPNKARR